MSGSYFYRRRLEPDLLKWETRGWVTPQGRAAILEDVGEGGGGHLQTILSILGALLLFAGVITFVSANWQEMSKLARLAVLFVSMWGVFGAAVWMHTVGRTYLREALLLLGAGMFGANIMLVAQVYHIEGDYPDAVLMWTLGAAAVALVLRSGAALVLAFVLAAIWNSAEISQGYREVHWLFFPVWLGLLAISWQVLPRAGVHLGVLTLASWLVFDATGLRHTFGLDEEVLALATGILGLSVFAVFVGRESTGTVFDTRLRIFAHYGLFFGLLITLFVPLMDHTTSKGELVILMASAVFLIPALVFAVRSALGEIVGIALITALIGVAMVGAKAMGAPFLWLHGAVFVAFCLWLIGFAYRRSSTTMLVFALMGFAGIVIQIYWRTFGDLLSTSVFFLIGGVLVLALAVGLETLRRVSATHFVKKPETKEVPHD